ncbi:MAG: response regulator [Candidatus Omnitrophica bacterium]|nr:response regulator [Candidatus Omnitrophota bacterium]
MHKVMVIDDDLDFLSEISRTLSLSGYFPVVLQDASRAFREIRKESPGIIILDLKMERASGFQIADRLSKDKRLKSIPVIGVTGYYTDKEHKTCMAICGITNCLTKPFNPLDLISAIENALGNKDV